MTTNNFHSEWRTVGKHRVLIECRDGFPGEDEYFIAEVSAKLVDNNSRKARVVSIYYDDKACIHTVTVASTKIEDCDIESTLTNVLQAIFNSGNFSVNIEMVKRGNEDSDHYNHMAHLSSAAKVGNV